ncbi:MAG: hypothetical protein JXQ81_01645 [Desulfuromonadales bacterium]|nr:hypothetical protein [Desulfuromonadales bacterium]MBN2791189.1 hypothetical protein [Desulfuromonadales bacterium]
MFKSWLFFIFCSILALFLAALLVQGAVTSGPVVASLPDGKAKQQLVSRLRLTDLSLCSEARYTRHPSQADLFSAFQDYPGSFEHFPTGSIILPQLEGFNNQLRIVRQGEN